MRPTATRFLCALFASAAPLAAATLTATAADDPTSQPITSVIELYTSQGCSSCPPADALLPSYIGKPGVLALSFNVDIWDNLGWKDTLAKPQFTQRQRAYAQTRGDGQVYTPQTIINGAAHAVGSDRAAINAAIKATAGQNRALSVRLSAAAAGDGIAISAPAAGTAPAKSDAILWLVKFAPVTEVAIKRGENSGHKVAYHNVVREFTAVGTWTGAAASVQLSQAALAGCTPGTCAVLLQQGGTGTILGATWVPGISGI